MVDMVTIGAGGGSLARLSDGALTVGPASAGATPGPACYGMGGEEPTVTDAHLVLGHLPDGLLGGGMALDRGLAERAVLERVARPLGLSLQAAARGILAIADANMVGAIRVVSVERGHDPRDFCLVAFGGAGPLHGCALAELLGITRVLVPPAPGVLCAEGLLAAGLKAEFSRTLAGQVEDGARSRRGSRRCNAMPARGWTRSAWRPADRRVGRVALMRYAGQGGELAVAWPGTLAPARAAFAEAHRRAERFRAGEPGWNWSRCGWRPRGWWLLRPGWACGLAPAHRLWRGARFGSERGMRCRPECMSARRWAWATGSPGRPWSRNSTRPRWCRPDGPPRWQRAGHCW